MLIAIHNPPDHEDSYLDGWHESLAARGVEVRFVDLAAPGAIAEVRDSNGVMWHWNRTFRDEQIAPALKVIEFQLGIPVFPDFASSWHRRDKLAQYYLMQAAGIPMPETRVFRDRDRARDWARQTDYPKVVKLSPGGGGRDVALVRSSEEALAHIDLMFGRGINPGRLGRGRGGSIRERLGRTRAFAGRSKAALAHLIRGQPPSARRPEQGYVYFQEFIEANRETVGISVIGERAFGALSVHSADDFRTESDKLDYDPSNIDLDCVRLAFDVCRRLGLRMMAFDMLMVGNEPRILEMNFRNGRMSGYWNRDLEWIDKPLMPQEAQVEAFLDGIRAGQSSGSSYSAATAT